jgi:hypothetical protein
MLLDQTGMVMEPIPLVIVVVEVTEERMNLLMEYLMVDTNHQELYYYHVGSCLMLMKQHSTELDYWFALDTFVRKSMLAHPFDFVASCYFPSSLVVVVAAAVFE